jgi:hypothetical protein
MPLPVSFIENSSKENSLKPLSSIQHNLKSRNHRNSDFSQSNRKGNNKTTVANSKNNTNTNYSTTNNNSNSSKTTGNRYKTELCRQFNENGECKYGDKCQFAHGLNELKDINRHPKYKTDFCKTFHSKGFCPYGPRCHFIHDINEKLDNMIGSNSLHCKNSQLLSSNSNLTNQETNCSTDLYGNDLKPFEDSNASLNQEKYVNLADLSSPATSTSSFLKNLYLLTTTASSTSAVSSASTNETINTCNESNQLIQYNYQTHNSNSINSTSKTISNNINKSSNQSSLSSSPSSQSPSPHSSRSSTSSTDSKDSYNDSFNVYNHKPDQLSITLPTAILSPTSNDPYTESVLRNDYLIEFSSHSMFKSLATLNLTDDLVYPSKSTDDCIFQSQQEQL